MLTILFVSYFMVLPVLWQPGGLDWPGSRADWPPGPARCAAWSAWPRCPPRCSPPARCSPPPPPYTCVTSIRLRKIPIADYHNRRQDGGNLCTQGTYIYRVQSNVWRLPKYWPPIPSPPSECVLPPHVGLHTRWALHRYGCVKSMADYHDINACKVNPIYVFLIWELGQPQSQFPHS